MAQSWTAVFLRVCWVCCWVGYGGISLSYASTDVEYRFERLWPKMDKNWYFNRPRGIAAGSSAYVYVADSFNNQVQVLTSEGEFIRSWGSIGSGDGNFNRPVALAVAADNSVYVVDQYNNRIQQFNAKGDFIRKWGGTGTGTDDQGLADGSGSNKGEFKAPQGIAVAANGNVIVADAGNHRIQIFKADGAFVSQFGRQGSAAGEFSFPNGISVAANGDLYVADTGNKRVQQFTAAGIFVRQWSTEIAANAPVNQPPPPQGSTPAAETAAPASPEPEILLGPAAIALLDGYVLVVDSNNHRILVFNAQGQFLRSWGSKGTDSGNFNQPMGIAAINHTLYITDYQNNRIQPFAFTDSSSVALRAWGSSGVDAGYFNDPVSVALTPSGDIYVVERSNNRIQQFKSDGSFIRQWGQLGTAAGQFNEPFGVAVSANQSSVYVSDANNHRIQQFSAQGIWQRSFGSNGAANGQFNSPKGLALAPDGSLYVADKNNHRIQQFTANGVFIRSWGSLGTQNGQFNEPQSVAVTPDGAVFVADKQNDRIQQFTATGGFVRAWSVQRNAKATNKPSIVGMEGITALADGSLMLADSRNQSIQQYSADGTLLRTLGTKGSGDGQFSYPSGVAVYSADGTDTVVVADMSNHRVQKFVTRNKTSLTTTSAAGSVKITHPYKAIIVAGGGEKVGGRVNDIWGGTWRIAQKAYKALSAQGFALHDEIYFMTAGSTEVDLDANGQFDDLKVANLQNLQQAITTWAVDAKEVVIFLADHGGPGKFQVNGTEILTGEALASWIAQLDQSIPGKVSVIVEACNSGSFIPYLAKTNHYLFSSVQSDQAAVISNEGLNSFSYFFWSEIMGGTGLQNAFKDARQAMSATVIAGVPRNAQADADGNQQYNDKDLTTLGSYCLGNCNSTAALPPVIQPMTPTAQTLQGNTQLDFSINVSALQKLDSAWFLVRRPDELHLDPAQPLNFEKIALLCDAQNQCRGSYPRFDTSGNYVVSFYAMDSQMEISAPESVTITQAKGKAVPAAQFDSNSNTLSLRTVQVGGQQFQAELQLQNGQWVLTALGKAAQSVQPASEYFADTGVLRIPQVLVNGQLYQATLQRQGDAFQIQQAGPL